MLDTARTLLVQELALAKGVEHSDVVRELDEMFPLQ
jgi:RNA polymerase-interacting CarD/CdnL/TRCF family regulator